MQFRIKELREKKRMSQQELCDKSGVTRTTISKLERGIYINAKVETLVMLADALGVSVRALFPGKNAQRCDNDN